MMSEATPESKSASPVGFVGLSPRFLRRGLLVLLVGTMTLIAQEWIGGSTIYGIPFEAKRTLAHQYLLENHPPEGKTWTQLGANGTNVRIGAVFAAEAIHRVTHLSILNAYWIIDTGALFLTLLLLFIYLQRWYDNTYCLIGLLFFGITLPLTYVLFAFHPWDRLSVLLWLVALYLLRDRRLVLLAIVLVLAVAVKYDSVVFPGLFFLAYATKRDWVASTLTTGALFVLTFGEYAFLRWAIPGGFEPNHASNQIVKNLEALRAFGISYPPWLGFTIPIILAAIGFRSSDRFVKASAVFGILLFVPFFTGSNFAEFRAEVPTLLLLLPASLNGMRLLLSSGAWTPTPALHHLNDATT